jgi:hypothetical protein
MANIIESEKEIINNKFFLNGFFWHNIKNEHSLSLFKDFEGSEENYIELLKRHFKHNATSFISSVSRLEKNKFIERIEAQFIIYTKEKNGNSEKWLEATKKTLINERLDVYQIGDIVLRGVFIEWYYLKIKNLKGYDIELQTQEPEPLDLSDTSAVEKIIYLNELGIIDFLRTKPEFIGSTNLMATVLSAITGEKLITLQPSLNPLVNNYTYAKNYPYKSKKTVNRVRQTLIDNNIKPKAS